MSQSLSGRDPLEELAEEFAERYRRGERPSLTEYTNRYPHLAEQVRELFPALVLVEQFGAAAAGSGDGLGSPAGAGDDRQQLGEYRIVREIGRGGMGVVYEAVQESLGRRVAVKVLPFHGLISQNALERFRREARTAARLHHTNIVPVFGVGEDQGVHYYAMQFIQGQGLDAVLEEVRKLRSKEKSATERGSGPGNEVSAAIARGLTTATLPALASRSPSTQAGMAPVAQVTSAPTAGQPSSLAYDTEGRYIRSVVRMGIQVADALAYAHQQDVLHRDIKPANLLLDLQGTIWISDFGLAKAERSDELTSPGDVVGTVRYMSPERFEGKADRRSDVYGLGITLYEMLTLAPAFDGSDRVRLMERIVHERPVPPRKRNARIPRDLETVVLKAIAQDPSERYPSADACAEDLRRILADRPILARRAPWRERIWRWCRRNRAVASLASAITLLLALIAAGSILFALQSQADLRRAASAETAEKASRQQALAELWESRVGQARAGRLSRRPGQRFASLRTIAAAMKLPLPPGRSIDELRTEAIACLLLPDFEIGHEGARWQQEAQRFSIAPDFKRYARGDLHGNVDVCSVADDSVICRLPGAHLLLDYGGMEFSPDGRFFSECWPTSSGRGGRVWRLDGQSPSVVLQGDYGGHAFSPDSRQLVAAYPDGDIRLYELSSGRELKRYRCPCPRWPQLVWNPQRRLLAVAPWNCTRLSLLNLDTGKVESELAVPEGISLVDWHPQGRILAVSEERDHPQVMLWDTVTGKQTMPPLEGQKARGVVVRFNHAGDRLLTTDWDGIWRLWDTRTGQLLITRKTEDFYHLAFRADDRLVGIDLMGHRLRLLNFRAGQELGTLVHRSKTPNFGPRSAHALDPEGRILAVYARDGILLIDLARLEESARLPLPQNAPLHFEPGGSLLTYGEAGLLRWPMTVDAKGEHRRFGPPEKLFGPTSVDSHASSRDGKVVAIPQYSRGAIVLRRGERKIVALHPQRDVRSCAVSPDGSLVATCSFQPDAGPAARVWDATTGRHVHDLPGQGFRSAQFSPDGKWLLTIGADIRIWSVRDWREGPHSPGAMGAWGAAFNEVGSLLALEGGLGEVCLVRPETGKQVAMLSVSEPTLLHPYCFSRDDTRLVCLGRDSGALYVFDLRLIRTGLSEIGLDWEAAPYLPAPSSAGAILRLQIDVVTAPRQR